jgi:regulation of enolase protein 1 (concanavalin A-like superfamily)
MVRESLEANARNAYAVWLPGLGHAFQYRTSTGGTTARVSGGASATPTWVRLARQGTRIVSYRSSDGQSWTQVYATTMSLPSDVLVGLAVTSRDEGAPAQATFGNVSVQTSAGSTAPPPSSTWTGAAIGSPRLAGSSTVSGGTYTVTGAGRDIWGTADQFRFHYQQVQGDAEIIARVSSFQAGEVAARAGVMIRESLTAGSKNAFMLASRASGWAFQRRIATNGETHLTEGPGGEAPGWVRITREGALFTAYHSTDGSTWRLIGTETISMSATVYVGLAVTSRNEYATATATMTNVTVRAPSTSSNQSPSVSLTSPASGATFTAPATVSMAATAADSDGSIARVEFYQGSTPVGTDTTSPFTSTWSNAPAGTHQLRAVATDNEGATTTSATVTITVNGTNNRAPTVSFTSPSAGAAFTAPATLALRVSASDSDGRIVRVRLYQGSTLLKDDVTNPYSHNWYGVPAGTYQLRAVAYDDDGATAEASVNVTVNGGGNQAPTVTITTPTSGASYTAPATVNVQATAADADGTVSRVEFYRGSTLIGTDTSSPYTYTWANASAGNYSLTARAYDNNGASRTSTAVNISVGTSSNQPPTVSITAPTNGASYTAPASMTITAPASDTDGSVANVDFYVGSQLIGSDSSAPYSAAWNNVSAGTYSLTAVARDNAGATRTSSGVSVTISSTPTRPTTLVFTASSNHATAVTSYTVAIYRTVDPVTATPVATRDIGRPTPSNGDISVDISTLINPLATGSYYAVVRAIGSAGTAASAPSATFTK